jgi:hypothetical protein
VQLADHPIDDEDPQRMTQSCAVCGEQVIRVKSVGVQLLGLPEIRMHVRCAGAVALGLCEQIELLSQRIEH